MKLHQVIGYFVSENNDAVTTLTGTESLLPSFLKLVVVLLMIIGLIIVLLRFVAQKNKTWFSQPGIRSLSALTIAQNRSIHIVEVGHKIYVLGVGEDVRVIDVLEEEEEISRLKERLEASKTHKVQGNWMQWIKKRKHSERIEEVEADHSDASFQQVMMDRLQHISSQKQKLHDLLEEDERNRKERK